MYEKLDSNNLKTAHPLLTLLFCGYLFYSFFEIYLNPIIGDSGKYLIFLIILLFFISYRSINIEIKWYHFLVLLWLLLKVASIYWASFNYIVQLHFLSQMGMVALFIIMTFVDFDEKFTTAIVNTLFFSSGLTGILCLFFSSPYLGIFDARQVLTLMGSQTDPNNQSAYLLVGIAIGLYWIFDGKGSSLFRMILLGSIAVNIYAIFLTGSRGGLLSAALIAVCAALLVDKGGHLISLNTVRNALAVGLSGFGVYCAVKFFLPADILARLFDLSDYAGGSGRVELWGNALELFKDNPLIGGGWGSYWGYNGYYEVVHNTFISVLADSGLIGFALLFIPLVYLAVKSLEQRFALSFLILIAGLAPAFFLDAINKRFFWNAIIIAFVLINGHQRQAQEIQEVQEIQGDGDERGIAAVKEYGKR